MRPPLALTIAAHDPIGGAGVAADLTTFAAFDVHGLVAITAVTAQGLGRVDAVVPTSSELLRAQLDGLLELGPIDAVKVGLLLDVAQVELLADRFEAGDLPAPVVDPVMVTGRGVRFVREEVEQACRARLFPVARVLTPNRAEAALLGGEPAALRSLGADLVVVTDGAGDGTDLLIDDRGSRTLPTGGWVDTANVRGSGCTFAAALTAELARGADTDDAARSAKRFVEARLRRSADWRFAGPGPLSHGCAGPQDTSAQSSP
ncbi:MAG: hydroxymethylpyrimidine/phosphomethylpyrimidine kinase [Acidimicrobiales bacterium]